MDNKPKKIRNVPHIEGNFNVFFYIKIKRDNAIKEILEEIVKYLDGIKDNPEIVFSYENVVQDNDYYHISLTETLFLKYHEIDNYLKKIKNNLSLVKPFSLLLTSKLKYYNNSFNTRHFLTLQVLKTKPLTKLLSTFSDENFSPHISLLWSDKSFSNCLPEEDLNNYIDKKFPQNRILQTIEVSEIYFTIGSRHNKIKLNPYLFNDVPSHDHDYRVHDDHRDHIFHQ